MTIGARVGVRTLAGSVFLFLLLPSVFAVAETWEEALDRLKPPVFAAGVPAVDASGLEGRVWCGYQGWFGAEGDGSGMGWKHYGGKNLAPGYCRFDLWPDLSEFSDDEKYPSPFRYADGSPASLFSSYNAKTVERHFRWMREYGIDGVFLQRFGTTLRTPRMFDFCTRVMTNARVAAAREGRVWAVMYDLSGLRPGEVLPLIAGDWKRLVDRAGILKDKGYLHHRGKPLVGVWGVGFAGEDRKYSLAECAALVDFLKHDPRYGGNAVLLGVPSNWRKQTRDASADPGLHALLRQADILSPWSVGRYRDASAAGRLMPAQLTEDQAWCEASGLGYLPVIFPGFSWSNLQRTRGIKAPSNAIDRAKGAFLWRQACEVVRSGSRAVYVAMFDEIDEGTAIFKCTNNPPQGESRFVTFDGLPSDHYLWLTGQIGRMLRGEMVPTDSPPPRGGVGPGPRRSLP